MDSEIVLTEKLRGKRLLIFDFDGTVADTTPMHAEAFALALAPHRLAVDYPAIAGMKTADAIRKCFLVAGRATDGVDMDALVAVKQRHVRHLISRALRPMPGVDAFLRAARGRYLLSMVTSGSSGTVKLALDKLGYTGWFDPFVCADDVSMAKPAPDGFLLALERAKVPADAALIFEDSAAGFEAARLARVDCVDVRGLDWSIA